MTTKNHVTRKSSFWSMKTVFIILLLLACGVRFVQRSAAQVAIGVPALQGNDAPASKEAVTAKTQNAEEKDGKPLVKVAGWSTKWKQMFARYETILQRPLTPKERVGLYRAYRTYRASVAKTLGVTTKVLTEKELANKKQSPASKPSILRPELQKALPVR